MTTPTRDYYLNARVRRVNVYRDERGTVRGYDEQGRILVEWDSAPIDGARPVNRASIALLPFESF